MTRWRDPRLPKRWSDVRGPGVAPKIAATRLIDALRRLDAAQRATQERIDDRLDELEAAQRARRKGR